MELKENTKETSSNY